MTHERPRITIDDHDPSILAQNRRSFISSTVMSCLGTSTRKPVLGPSQFRPAFHQIVNSQAALDGRPPRSAGRTRHDLHRESGESAKWSVTGGGQHSVQCRHTAMDNLYLPSRCNALPAIMGLHQLGGRVMFVCIGDPCRFGSGGGSVCGAGSVRLIRKPAR